MIIEELDELFESATIKPTFEKVHVILALFIFEENREGIGRYRLQKDLSIGAGTAKSLITKLKENIGFITVLSSENKRKGHVLTEKGLDFLKKMKHKIPLIEKGDTFIFKDIIIESKENFSYFCLVKKTSNKISNGIDQRDAAIKIGGIGATCLIFDGKSLIFPSQKFAGNEEEKSVVDQKIFTYIQTQINRKNSQLEEKDVIIIGLGKNPQKARLATLNAALTLI
jgi:predicted transcriptional regulator